MRLEESLRRPIPDTRAGVTLVMLEFRGSRHDTCTGAASMEFGEKYHNFESCGKMNISAMALG